MKRAIALVLMLPSIALAQTPTDPQGSAIPTPATTGAETNPTAPLLATTANGHNCGTRFYPPAAIAAHEEGVVGLGFLVGTDGSTKNIVVSSTSGFPDLDQAAVACAAQWKYRPALQDGRPVEVDWKANVKWSISATGNPHICGHELYPPAALAAGEQGSVALSFRIGTDGSPKNVAVSATSGYPDLDQAAVACAAQWKYRPALQDGRPVEVDWKANVKWSMEPSD